MKPTEGSVEIKGKIVPLLELGAGFDSSYTGKENIFLNGAMLGLSKEFLEEKYEEIVDFSEIRKFINVPLKNYSSGMRARLGFSIATTIKPEILILDEVLSVGDAKFRKKSENKIKSLFNEGITVLFVSHSIDQVKKLCNKAIWLEKGEIVMKGDAKEVCAAYEEICKSDTSINLISNYLSIFTSIIDTISLLNFHHNSPDKYPRTHLYYKYLNCLFC